MRPFWVHHAQAAGYSALTGFLSDRIFGRSVDMTNGTIMAVTKGGAVCSAVLFHNYDPEAGIVEISAASDDKRWLTRAVLLELFSYAFGDLGCQAVVARIERETLARIFTAYGFERYDIPRLRGRGKAETILVLTQEAWTGNGFHKENEYGQKSAFANPA